MASTGVSVGSYVRLVRGNANFRRLWLAQIVSENGDWFYTLAIYSLLLDLTGKASSVAMALVLQVLPHTLLGPLAGIVNDRFSRRKVMIVTDLLRMVIVACMLLVRSRGFVWVIYPLLFLETVMVAFFEPARNAVIPNVVDEQDVIVANTLSSATWSFDLAIGSMLGGIVAAWLGRDAVFIINSLSFAASALLISRMNFVERHADAANRHAEDQSAGWSSIRAGFRYIAGNPKLAALVSLKGGVSIVGTSWVLYPVMAMRVFKLPIEGLTPERAGLFGMSLADGSPGHWSARGSAGGIAIHRAAREQVASRSAGGIYHRRHRVRRARKHVQRVGGDGGDCAGTLRHVHGMGVFDHTTALKYRGPISWKSLRRGLGNFDARTGCGNLDCRAGHRQWSLAAHSRRSNGSRDGRAVRGLGSGIATVAPPRQAQAHKT